MRKQFQTIEELAETVEGGERVKDDFIVPTAKLAMTDDEHVGASGVGDLEIGPIAHDQLADWVKETLGVHGSGARDYYRALGRHPGLRATVLGRLFADSAQRRMLRTHPGRLRAFLSDRYQPKDNWLVLQALMPVLLGLREEGRDVTVSANAVTESRLYLQIIFGDLQQELTGRGFTWGHGHNWVEVLMPALTVTNSEVGMGSLNVQLSIWRKVCSNTAIMESVVRAYHAGRRIENDDDSSIYSNETVQADQRAYELALRDTIRHATKPEVLTAAMETVHDAQEEKIAHPIETIERVTKYFAFSKEEGDRMLENFVHENNVTRWGLVNSVTALAKMFDSPDRQYEAERAGGELLGRDADGRWKIPLSPS